MKTKYLITCIALIHLSCLMASAQNLYPLYKGPVPNSISDTTNEVLTNRAGSNNQTLSKVTVPRIKVYLPEKAKATGAAVVICPGGGYSGLAITHEGDRLAEEFQKIGVAAIILYYRLPSDLSMKDKSIGPLQDAQQAIKTVRERAAEWNVDVNKVGILGFSAGGHLASTAGTHFSKALIPNANNTSVRPDFMVLIYPVISFSDELAHLGSRTNLIGKNPSPEKIKEYSNDLQVTSATPVTFLVHAGDDRGVKVENSLNFYQALHKNGVDAALIVYPKGGHGFGMVNGTTTDKWFDHLKNWMKSQQFIP
ncbi:alpha/beta hydrolase [Pedobacter sp. MC2016-14]|uniref:alpha/beta hydrolase n=1 Tax=Pedobacter sp. MC2016-14 TaxID=2897327 RepID=UPI001E48E6E6|nr:alpha/beta hydrolase [Pedobacter sp. MC2016-14]MCD0488903.1 alpha/beta hydrolase [Pedobacter sp. MC2016-14]